MLAGTERMHLDATSWVDVGRQWLGDADEVLAALSSEVSWQAKQVWRYDHAWCEPRLSGVTRPGLKAAHPAVTRIHKELRRAYGVELAGATLVQYRDGDDSMASHRDGDLRWCEDTLVAVISVGAGRPWTLTPRGVDHTQVIDLAPGHGDVLVMGGRCQSDWVHGVPRAPGVSRPRVSMQWRWTSRTGRPERGATSSAPRHYGGGR